MTGKIDEISEAIGRLDAYTHDQRHGINNMMQMIRALDAASERRHATLKAELAGDISRAILDIRNEIIPLRNDINSMRAEAQTIDGRVRALESVRLKQEGALGVGQWFADHWPFAGMAALLATWLAWIVGKLHG